MIEFDANRKALTRLRIDVPEEPVVQKLLH
jgi:hypothetical protein